MVRRWVEGSSVAVAQGGRGRGVPSVMVRGIGMGGSMLRGRDGRARQGTKAWQRGCALAKA